MPDPLTAPRVRRRIALGNRGIAAAGAAFSPRGGVFVVPGEGPGGCPVPAVRGAWRGPPPELQMRSDRRSAVRRIDLAIGIGGAAGQGIATPGDILARIFVRRGLHVNAYNAYQSIIRGGHIFLTLRTSDQPVLSHADKIDVRMPVYQAPMKR